MDDLAEHMGRSMALGAENDSGFIVKVRSSLKKKISVKALSSVGRSPSKSSKKKTHTDGAESEQFPDKALGDDHEGEEEEYPEGDDDGVAAQLNFDAGDQDMSAQLNDSAFGAAEADDTADGGAVQKKRRRRRRRSSET